MYKHIIIINRVHLGTYVCVLYLFMTDVLSCGKCGQTCNISCVCVGTHVQNIHEPGSLGAGVGRGGVRSGKFIH